MASFRNLNLFSCLAMGLTLFMLNLDVSEAKEFLVGGKENSWGLPTSANEFNQWAEKERFQIGDSLVLKYNPNSDSVLQVSEEDYQNCNKAKPIKSYDDGNTKIELDKSGPYFFISGTNGHCEKGEKLEVKVLSPKHSNVPVTAPAPAPSHTPKEVSAPPPAAPSNGAAALMTSGVATMVLCSLLALAMA